MFKLLKRSDKYFSYHPMINSWAHALGGFGLALIFQQYLKGDAFLPAWLGWAFIILSLLMHLRSILK